MQKFIICVLISTFSNFLFAQNNINNTYLDAIRLAEIYTQSKKGNYSPDQIRFEFNEVLIKYKTSISSDSLRSNPFLDQYLPAKFEMSSGVGHSGADKIKYDQLKVNGIQSNTSYGTNWQSAIIRGSSDFIAKRFSAELMDMGIQKMFKKLADAETAKLANSFFPKSIEYIKKNQKDNSGVYTADLSYLKQIILTELDDLPNVIVKKAEFNDEQKDILQIGFDIVKNTKQGYNIPQVIDNLDNLNLTNKRLSSLLHSLALFSNSFKNKEGEKTIWINPFTELSFTDGKDDQLIARYFYALLYEQLKKEPIFKDRIRFYSTQIFLEDIKEISFFINQLNQTYSFAQNKNFVFSSIDDYISYTLSLTNAIESFLNNKVIVQYEDINARANLDTYLKILEPFLKKDYQRGISILLLEFKESNDYIKSIRNISVLVEIASIDKDDDMKNLLEAYALPIGSSSIKRISKWNISANGYVGLTAGWEKAYGSEKAQTRKDFGLSAPIGISFSYMGKSSYNQSLTLFFSFIDLGSMVNVRLQNDTSSYSDLRFEHFLAPGAGLYYNFKNTPISLGLHYNYIPNLRTIKYENNNTIIIDHNVSVNRLNFSLLIDIPLFTLFNN